MAMWRTLLRRRRDGRGQFRGRQDSRGVLRAGQPQTDSEGRTQKKICSFGVWLQWGDGLKSVAHPYEWITTKNGIALWRKVDFEAKAILLKGNQSWFKNKRNEV